MTSVTPAPVATTAFNDDFLQPLGQTLRNLIPAAAGKMVIPQFTTMAPRQMIPVYFLDHMTTTERERKAVMLCLTLSGRCTDERPAAWQSWVLTWSAVCFPELVSQFRDASSAIDYVYTPFDKAFIQDCVSAVEAQMKAETAGDRFVTPPAGLPTFTVVPVTPELVMAMNMEAFYAYYAMIVFIMGKSLSPENVTALSTKRPDALIRKRSLGAYAYILTGEGQIHPDHYKRVQSGWIRSTQLRIVVVRHLAKMNAAPTRSEILDSVSVNMELLRNANQSYLFYIHELLTACPWALNIPALRSPYYHYCRMVSVIMREEEYLRPYYKLMMQDAAKDVRRRDIESLISAATFFAAQTRKTMNKYRINEGTLPVITAFKAEALKHGVTFNEVQDQLMTEVATV